MKKWMTIALLVCVGASVQAAVGDSTKEEFIAREKVKWQKKGWRWDQAKVDANFAKMDADGDGILSGKEKQAFWGKGKKAAAKATPAKPVVKLSAGDSTLEMFLSVQKAQSAKKGRKFNQAGAEKMFKAIDADGNGVITGAEKKAYWKK